MLFSDTQTPELILIIIIHVYIFVKYPTIKIIM